MTDYVIWPVEKLERIRLFLFPLDVRTLPPRWPNTRARMSGSVHSINREFLRELKMWVGCVDCGYNADYRQLDFDHLNPETKLGSPLEMVGLEDKASAELGKCVVRCKQCHHAKSVRTGQVRGPGRKSHKNVTFP